MTGDLLSRDFSRGELACHHCGQCYPAVELVNALQLLRDLARMPVMIHDACRCPVHNAAVGGAAHSEHVFDIAQGIHTEAADLSIAGKTLQQMYDLALQVPAFASGGIGVYDGNFIHVDVRRRVARWARRKGKYIGIAESKLVRV